MSKALSLLCIVTVLSCNPKGKIGSGVYIGSTDIEGKDSIITDSSLDVSNEAPYDSTLILNFENYAFNDSSQISNYLFTDSINFESQYYIDSLQPLDKIAKPFDTMVEAGISEIIDSDSLTYDPISDSADFNEQLKTHIVEIDTVTLDQKPQTKLPFSDTISDSLKPEKKTVVSMQKEKEISEIEISEFDSILSTSNKIILDSTLQASDSGTADKQDSLVPSKLEPLNREIKTHSLSDSTQLKSDVILENSEVKNSKVVKIDTALQIQKAKVVIKTPAPSTDVLKVNESGVDSIEREGNGVDTLAELKSVDSQMDDSLTLSQEDKAVKVDIETQKEAQVLKQDALNFSKSVELQNRIEKLEKVVNVLSSNKEEIKQEKIKSTSSPTFVTSATTYMFYFESGSKVPNNQIELVDSVMNAFSKSFSKQVLISGYTDAIGNYASNMALSLKRAESIKQALINRGIDERNIYIQYFGEKYHTSKSNSINRRVEVSVI